MNKARSSLDTLASISIIVACSVMVWFVVSERRQAGTGTRVRQPQDSGKATRSAAPLPAAPIPLDGAVLRGDPAARVVMVVYSDFECPFSRRFAQDVMPSVDQDYIKPGQVQLAFRHVPLERIHPLAVKAAEGVECAGIQGRFWEMHDQLFGGARLHSEDDLHNAAGQLGLDVAQFTRCLGGLLMTGKVRGDLQAASRLGISSTPTLLFGLRQNDGLLKVTRRLAGVRPYEELREILNGLLSTASSAGSFK